MKLLYFTVGVMMAHQVMGKAARDALLLTYFAEHLPLMRIGAAMFAMLVGLAVPRLFQRYGLTRTVPVAFAASGLLHFVEYAIRNTNPKLTAVLVFLHVVSLSAILLSSFWLLLSERFDPGEARRWFGKFAAFGTLGGVAGGIVAERWSAAGLSGMSLLVVLGAFHIICGIAMRSRSEVEGPAAITGTSPWLSPSAALASAPYLRILALIVFLGTTSAAIIDLLFNLAAVAALDSGPGLWRFFALFHTVTQVVVFLFQSFAVQTALDRFSLGRNVASLPMTVILASCGGFLFPFFPVLAFARGSEYLVRGSFFRSGYEVYYTPIPPREKRAAKSLIDVVCDRLGDAAGGVVVQALLPATVPALCWIALPVAALIGLANLVLSLRLDRTYSHVVHLGLTDRARQINERLSQYGDWSVDTVLLESVPRPPVVLPSAPPAPPPQMDETTRRFVALRSGDAERVRRTLQSIDVCEPVLTPVLVELLGWGEVWKDARAALTRTGQRHIGQLVDALIDPKTDVAIRRRVPSILATCRCPRSVEGLIEGMSDGRFEVRLQCARALDLITREAEELSPTQDQILTLIDRELSRPPRAWQSRTDHEEAVLLGDTGYLDETLDRPVDYRLELIFSLLALRHERDPLKAAFRALHTKDKMTYALGLEYVDSLLPAAVRSKFHGLLGPSAV